jgi:cyclopropane fatty-acyl-phospholipid synthase-like methyltransferase
METRDNALAAKYNEAYQDYKITKSPAQSTMQARPVRIRGWPTDLRQALIYLARPGGRLLEIGCGGGEVLATLAPCFNEVIGAELSRVQAERARQGLAHLPNCIVLNEPLERLMKTVNPPFDCIIWADVIEHIVDVIGAMHILADLSRPGTQLVTVTPNVAFLPHRLRLLLGRAPTTASRHRNRGFKHDLHQTVLFDAGHLHYFTFRQVEMLYRLAGFRSERRLGIASRWSRLRNYWPTLLSSSVCVSGTFRGAEV